VFNFTGSQNDNYLRVPLGVFAVDTGSNTCELYISTMTSSTSIMMGTQFFQEFYTAFVNDYSNPFNLYQQAQIYVSTDAVYSPYIGSTVLPDGPNPFSPDNGNTGLGTWLIVGIVVAGVSLVVLVVVMLLCCLQ